MARRGDLSDDELVLIKKYLSDEEAFEKFFRDCYLSNLRPGTIEYYQTNFMRRKSLLKRI